MRVMDYETFPAGLTVEELRQVLKDLPGSAEIWLGNKEGTSSQARGIWPLGEKDIIFTL